MMGTLSILRKQTVFHFAAIVLGIFWCLGNASAQESRRLQPKWWFGGAAGANFNFYSADIKSLNASNQSISPPFKDGSGTGLFLSPLLEFRPDPVWGGMVTLGFDGRSGSFDDVAVPQAGSNKLSATMNYVSLEPSLRISPFPAALYFYAGPRFGFNVAKSFEYTPVDGPKIEGEWSGVRGTAVGGQVGAGYDLSLSDPDATTQVNLSPFVAFHFGEGPRTEDSWSMSTVRVGLGLKFGSTGEVKERIAGEVRFSVRAPRIIPSERRVRETFPVRNYIFFEEGSNEIPSRYVTLSRSEADQFRESQLLEPKPKDLTGRSRRQLTVYHNVLNIIGDRMRRHPQAMLRLSGSSDRGSSTGRAFAESVKRYLTDVFGIDASRISTEGRERPAIPSVQPGGTRELDLVRPEDRRVEITSATPELMDPVQIISLQEDPLDGDVIFNVAGAQDLLASWSVEAIDENGKVKRLGPFTSDQERIPGKEILGDRMQGRYTMVLDGTTKAGQSVRKEESVRLVRSDEPEADLGLRYSILFEFDQSKTVATYDRFLSSVVAPLIPEGGSVVIHGHTDIVGEEGHNLKLSRDRSNEAMKVLQRELRKAGKSRVKFDTYGFGEDARRSPFDNRLPEERFYNRTVIIDILSN